MPCRPLHNFSENGLNPLVDITYLKLQWSCAKSTHFSSTCAWASLFATWRTNPSTFLCVACHYSNFDVAVDLYIHFSFEILGKWHTTFTCTFILPTCLYLRLPHFGQWMCLAYCPLYKIHLEIQAWILLYSRPICWHKIFAPYMLLDKQLLIGNMNLWNNENNSCTNLFEHSCIVHMLTIVIVVTSLLHQMPSYKGIHTPYIVTTWSTWSCSMFGHSRFGATFGCFGSMGLLEVSFYLPLNLF
jgi:hypothetical protein